MKLILLFLIFTMVHVSANSFAQRVSLSKNNSHLVDVLKEIQRQTNVDFVYSNKLMSQSKRVTIDVANMPLNTVLENIFISQPITYAIDNNAIIIKEKTAIPTINHVIVNELKLNSLQQYWEIIGIVTDEKSVPIAGVTVEAKEITPRVSTNNKGAFTLKIPSQKQSISIEFSFLGKKRKILIVSREQNKFLEIKLVEQIDDIEEIQITGYQMIDKRYTTSEITTLKMDDILVPGMNSVDLALEGRVPDLMFMQNSGEVGSTPRLRVRGTSTLLGNREPLWVLDGFIMHDPVNVNNEDLNNPDYINIIGNAIAGINPQDIERVDILKDASATALYGTRAANGVIVVTTKKGSVGPARVSFNHSSKITERPRYSNRNINLMNSQERMSFGQELTNLHYQFPSNMPMVGYEGSLYNYYKGVLNYEQFIDQIKWYETVNTDWFDLLTREGYSNDNTLSVSGGNSSQRYYASLGYNNEQGVSIGTKTKRYTGRINLDFTIKEKVKANISVFGNSQKRNHLHQDINAMDYAYNTTRTLPVYNEDGTLYYYNKVGYNGLNRPNRLFRYNILNEINNSSNDYDGNTLGANLNLRYSIIKNLDLTLAGSYNTASTMQEQWWGEKSHYVARLKNDEYEAIPRTGETGYSQLPYGGILNSNNSRQESFTLRSQVDYRGRFGNESQHMLTAMGGFEVNGNNYKTINDQNRGFVKERGLQFIDAINLDLYPFYKTWINTNHMDLGYDINRQVSAYSSFGYSYKNSFTLNANARIDASNKFGSRSNEKMLPVWSFSGMFNAKNVLFSDIDMITDFRIRSSVGIQGNMLDDQSPNLIIRQGTINPQYNENVSTIARYPNPNLLWEKTRQYNLSSDISLFQDRITVGGSLYYKITRDAFTTVKISSVNGVSGNTYLMNGGDVENKGYNLSLSVVPVRKTNLNWRLSTYFGGNFNKLKTNAVDVYNLNDYLNGTALVGNEPISTFYSYKFLGLNPTNGAPLFNDFNDRRHLLEDKTLEEIMMMVTVNSGQREPIFSGAFSSTLTYKKISLMTNFTYSLGAKMRLFSMYEPILNGVSAENNVRKEFLDRWMNPGDENYTNIPVIMSPSHVEYLNYIPHFSSTSVGANAIHKFANNAWSMYDLSDVRVVSANYLKLSTLSLRYSLSPKLLKRTPFSNLNTSFNTINLFTISAKELNGQDPTQAGFAKPNLSIRPTYTLQFNLSF